MADIRYYARHNGEIVKLTNIAHEGEKVGGRWRYFFTGKTPDGTRIRADRAIEYKRNPSKHECGPRCMEARGHLCECSCGGRNHGAGQI